MRILIIMVCHRSLPIFANILTSELSKFVSQSPTSIRSHTFIWHLAGAPIFKIFFKETIKGGRCSSLILLSIMSLWQDDYSVPLVIIKFVEVRYLFICKFIMEDVLYVF